MTDESKPAERWIPEGTVQVIYDGDTSQIQMTLGLRIDPGVNYVTPEQAEVLVGCGLCSWPIAPKPARTPKAPATDEKG